MNKMFVNLLLTMLKRQKKIENFSYSNQTMQTNKKHPKTQ